MFRAHNIIWTYHNSVAPVPLWTERKEEAGCGTIPTEYEKQNIKNTKTLWCRVAMTCTATKVFVSEDTKLRTTYKIIDFKRQNRREPYIIRKELYLRANRCERTFNPGREEALNINRLEWNDRFLSKKWTYYLIWARGAQFELQQLTFDISNNSTAMPNQSLEKRTGTNEYKIRTEP